VAATREPPPQTDATRWASGVVGFGPRCHLQVGAALADGTLQSGRERFVRR